MNKEIRQDILLMILVFGLLFIGIIAYDLTGARVKQKNQESAESKNLFILNHYAYSLLRILVNNDRGTLEAEYNRLSGVMDTDLSESPRIEALVLEAIENLNGIRQEEPIRIYNMKLHEKKVEKIILDQVIPAAPGQLAEPKALSRAMAALIRNDFNFSNYSGNILGHTAFSGRQIWPLEHQDVEIINKLYKKTINLHAAVLENSNEAADMALPPDGCKSLIESHKIPDSAARHHILMALAEDYHSLPPYWYYRAVSAAAAAVNIAGGAYDKQYIDDFKHCLDYYERHYKIFKNDEQYADLLMIDLLITPYSTQETRKQLALIMASGRDLSTKRLFAGLALMRSGLYADAVIYLQNNIDDERYKAVSGILMAEALTAKKDRAGLWRLLNRVMPDETVSNQEKLYYLSKISDEVALKRFLPQINGIKIVDAPGLSGHETLLLILPAGWVFDTQKSLDSTLVIGDRNIKPIRAGQSQDGNYTSLLLSGVTADDNQKGDMDGRQISLNLATEYLPLTIKGKLLAGKGGPKSQRQAESAREAALSASLEEMISEATANLGLEVSRPNQARTAGFPPGNKTKPERDGSRLIIEEISTNGSCWHLVNGDSLQPCPGSGEAAIKRGTGNYRIHNNARALSRPGSFWFPRSINQPSISFTRPFSLVIFSQILTVSKAVSA